MSRVRWKLFFIETNSHHTVQILKSFIFMHCKTYGMQQILLNFVFLHAQTKLLYKNFNFSYSWALQKWPVFMRNIMKFRAKKIFISNECAILCKTGFVLIRKWCRITCKTTKLLRKEFDCFVETLGSNLFPWIDKCPHWISKR